MKQDRKRRRFYLFIQPVMYRCSPLKVTRIHFFAERTMRARVPFLSQAICLLFQ